MNFRFSKESAEDAEPSTFTLKDRYVKKTVAFHFQLFFLYHIEHASGFGKVLLNQPALN